MHSQLPKPHRSSIDGGAVFSPLWALSMASPITFFMFSSPLSYKSCMLLEGKQTEEQDAHLHHVHEPCRGILLRKLGCLLALLAGQVGPLHHVILIVYTHEISTYRFIGVFSFPLGQLDDNLISLHDELAIRRDHGLIQIRLEEPRLGKVR